MKKRLKYIIPGIIVLLIITFCAVLYFIQDSQLYYPSYGEKSDAYLSERPETYQKIFFEGKNGAAYSGWMKKASLEEEKPATILFFGGNGMSSAIAFANLDVKGLWGPYEKYNYIMVDYPGYGLSSGKPSEKTIMEMALDTFDYVSGMDNITEIYIMGFSYGTSPAVYTAANRDTAGLILLAPFDNGTNLVNRYFNIFHGPLKLLVKNRLESDKYARDVSEKVLIVVSDADVMVANKLSENLSDSFPEKPAYITFSGLTHNEIFYNKAVMEYAAQLIEQNRQH